MSQEGPRWREPMAERKGRELGKVVGTAIGSHWIGTQSNERQREAERERESSCLGYMLLLGPYQTLKANRAGSQPKADPEDSTGRKKKARDGKKKRKTKYSRHPYSQQRRCLADTWDNVYKMRLPLLLLSINFPSIQKEPPSLPWKVNITKARRGT